jgi:hypothetical protein
VISAADYRAIQKSKKITFHFNGDMGGIQYAVPQELVAKGMEADFASGGDPSERPAFLYIVGDCVYFNGQVEEYYKQFYQPYEFYNGPIFAVPGNHDGENLLVSSEVDGNMVPPGSSLDGFVRNFCAPSPVKREESQDSHRTAMVQPNVYWTLITPCVNIVGLYSNVPAGGEIKADQADWLKGELQSLPKSVPLLVTLHHPIYSADDHHSGSVNMYDVIENASAKAKRAPDMVVAGHVHNYQRLTRKITDGTIQPHLVTGAGGYHNLHHIMLVNGQHMIPPAVFKDKKGRPVTLERYSDDHFGFLRLEISGSLIVGRYFTVPRPQDPYSKGNQLLDYWEYDWRKKAYVPNAP